MIYRAVAKALLDEGFDLTDEARAVAVAIELDPEKFGHPELKSQRIGDAASVVSAIPSVARRWSVFSASSRPIRQAPCSTGATSEP